MLKPLGMQNSVLFSPIPLDDLASEIRSIVRAEIIAQNQTELQERLLSPEEVRKLFTPKISRVTLSAWDREGRLSSYRIGGRVWYKYSDVMEALEKLERFRGRKWTNSQNVLP